MNIKQVTDKINNFAPQHLAYEWDNVGLLFGSETNEVQKILLTLDMDIEVAKEAVKTGANLIIGHHPILFNPIQRICDTTAEGRLLMFLAENKISYFAAHTNLDIAKGGLNDLIAHKLGLTNVNILEYTDENNGIGRIGKHEKITLDNLAKKVKEIFKAPYVRVCGNSNTIIENIAVNSGGGTALIDAALKMNADVLITGDYKYSQMRDCVADGLNVIDIGHYNTEIICKEIFYNCLKDDFADQIKFSEANKNVMRFL